jgi:sugar phosphate isomerase/epimerase
MIRPVNGPYTVAEVRLCLVASTPDMRDLDFIVKLLTGTPEEVVRQAVAWGYDGIEFMPDPERPPDPEPLQRALRDHGAVLPVVNSGRFACQGLALIQEDLKARRAALAAFKRLLDFASCFQARVGLGIARGSGKEISAPQIMGPDPSAGQERSNTNGKGLDRLTEDIFRELAEHAARNGVVIMLEPIDPGGTRFIHTMQEVMTWVDRINSPAFSVMLDTEQLAVVETSLDAGIRAARGQARHIHLYDPGRWPPGIRPAESQLDWPAVIRCLRGERFSGSASVFFPPEGNPEVLAPTTAHYLRRLFACEEEGVDHSACPTRRPD